MAKYIVDILKEVDADPALLKTTYAGNAALRTVFENAFLPENKWLLPEGDAPYKQTAEPLGMTPTNIYTELRRFYIFRRQDLEAIRRESIFISLLEGVHESEAKLLVAIKDQVLPSLYKNITAEVVADAGFITLPVQEEVKPVAKKAAAKKTTAKKATKKSAKETPSETDS